MKNIVTIILKNIVFAFVLFFCFPQQISAQTNLTYLLEINSNSINNSGDLLADFTSTGGGNHLFTNVINGLQNATVKGDCFIITMDLTTSDFPSTQSTPVLKFVINSKLIFEIGVRNKNTWYISRPLDVSGYASALPLIYDTYDLDVVAGKFTFIIGHYFTAITCDTPDGKFKMAPFYFGMDSNLDDRQLNGGLFKSHMGEFTGSSVFFPNAKYVYGIKGFKVFRMSGKSYAHQGGSGFYDRNAWEENKYSMDRLLRFLNNKITETIANRGVTVDTVKTNIVEENIAVESNDLSLYPNPNKGTFTVDFFLKEASEVSFKIFNLEGMVVYEESNKTFSKGSNSFQFTSKTNLNAGVYLLQINSAEFSKTIKFLVE